MIDWINQDLNKLDFKYRVGNSVLTEFVKSHDAAAVFKELVQNEYDAGGSKLEVTFGKTVLTIRGNGTPIDKKGWNRLSLVLGTGLVGEEDEEVEAKKNGIGSKNFGMRSLFLFGDSIFIQSGGRRSVIDYLRGAVASPLADPETAKSKGVTISVPFREQATSELKAFTKDDEVEVMNLLARSIPQTLIKLGEVKSRKNLREVIVTSERLSRVLSWKQATKQLPKAPKGYRLMIRKGTMSDTDSEKKKRVEELEWQRLVEIPPHYSRSNFPGYFCERGNRLKIGLSVSTKNGRLNQKFEGGIIYYPLGVTNAYTGNQLSINAPFEMDADRSQIIDPSISDLNGWIIDVASEMTIELLSKDWFDRFGPGAYSAVDMPGRSTVPKYSDLVEQSLKMNECWPSRKYLGKSKSLSFKKASDLNVAEGAHLDGFLDDEELLHNSLSKNSRIREVALQYGVQRFTLNSLVRLRCAGEDSSVLNTKAHDGERSYYFTDFPNGWNDVVRQVNCVDALNASSKHLSNSSREDLKTAPTTLNAALSLSPSLDLYRVPLEIAAICPVAPSQRLHPEIAHSKILGHPWTNKALAKWIQEICQRAIDGETTDPELQAIYKYVLSVDGRLPQNAKRAVMNAPVIRDSKNNWVCPKEITLRNAKGARSFGPALFFPHNDYSKNAVLLRTLHVKHKITSEDIIRFAYLASQGPELSRKFEDALKRNVNLITRKVVTELQDISFLICTDGELRSPSDVYLNNPDLLACVGPDANYPEGSSRGLYKKLGCRSEPRLKDILVYLNELISLVQRPDMERMYPALVESLKRERGAQNLDCFKDQKILWVSDRFSKPVDTLTGAVPNKMFPLALPCTGAISSKVSESFIKLGAHSRPTEYHWSKLLVWIGGKYFEHPKPLDQKLRKVVRQTYLNFMDKPELPAGLYWLLDDKGHLNSKVKIRQKTFLIDDDFNMSKQIRSLTSSVCFADTEVSRTIHFYHRLNVQRLSQARRLVEVIIGEACKDPHWFHSDLYLERLTRDSFSEALELLVDQDLKQNSALSNRIPKFKRQLSLIKEIKFVEHINVHYKVGSLNVHVPTRANWQDEIIFITPVKSRNDLYASLASCMSEKFTNNMDYQRRLADSLYRLIDSNNMRDIKRYLEMQGIDWNFTHDDEDDEDINGLVEMALVENIVSTNGHGNDVIVANASQSDGVDEFDTDSKEDEASDPLPSIDEVDPKLLNPTSGWAPPSRSKSSSKKRSGNFSRTGRQNSERDNEIGDRGEEIVYRLEIERVRILGIPEDKVIWVSKDNPTADHDICSIDDDGKTLFIEVKSTSGDGGQFYWSKAEFNKALRDRKRYILYRVYNAGSKNPTIRPFRDPVALLRKGAIRLDFESLRAEIEPL